MASVAQVFTEEALLKQVASEVRAVKLQFRGLVSEETVDLVAAESMQRLAHSRVKQYVPLFVGRFTRERLREILSQA